MDEKLIWGAIVIAVFMFVVTLVGSNIEPKKQSEKKIIYKENSWIIQPQKNQ